MNPFHCFITGTDTEVGKTYFTSWLVRQWRQRGYPAVGLKPIASGDQSDAIQLREASGHALSLDEINPVHFQTPISPYAASQMENRSIDFSSLQDQIQKQCRLFSHVAVEGVGGWLAPLASGKTVREWAFQLRLPIVVVARAEVGTINHTLLTIESIRLSGQTCLGIILNRHDSHKDPRHELQRRIITEFTRLPLFEFSRAAELEGNVPSWLGG